MPADSVVASGLCEGAGAMLERSGSGFALSRSGVRAATELAAASARSIGVCCRRCDPEGVDDEWSVSPCFSKCLRATNAAPIKAETPAKMPNICPVENGVAPLSFAARSEPDKRTESLEPDSVSRAAREFGSDGAESHWPAPRSAC